jgi:hypothetical protein
VYATIFSTEVLTVSDQSGSGVAVCRGCCSTASILDGAVSGWFHNVTTLYGERVGGVVAVRQHADIWYCGACSVSLLATAAERWVEFASYTRERDRSDGKN